jgi:3,4-dihydroxy 2-butanone 4-phosphate synthase/GTP cyclohydrolase II
VRAGHTEAAVDISRMAGLYPAGVICEIMNDDGTMARMPDLVSFAQLHGLKIGTIADLIAWRRENDRFLERRVEAPLDSAYADGFRTVVFRNGLDGTEHVALVKGDITPDSETLVRVHRMDLMSDVLAQRGPREGLVQAAMHEIANHDGPGVIVFVYSMMPDILATRLGAKSAEAPDGTTPLREYGIGAQILRDLGVRKLVFLSDTPPTRLVGLDGYGLSIEGWRPFKNKESTS